MFFPEAFVYNTVWGFIYFSRHRNVRSLISPSLCWDVLVNERGKPHLFGSGKQIHLSQIWCSASNMSMGWGRWWCSIHHTLFFPLYCIAWAFLSVQQALCWLGSEPAWGHLPRSPHLPSYCKVVGLAWMVCHRKPFKRSLYSPVHT